MNDNDVLDTTENENPFKDSKQIIAKTLHLMYFGMK
jgi:hypothetical protein